MERENDEKLYSISRYVYHFVIIASLGCQLSKKEQYCSIPGKCVLQKKQSLTVCLIPENCLFRRIILCWRRKHHYVALPNFQIRKSAMMKHRNLFFFVKCECLKILLCRCAEGITYLENWKTNMSGSRSIFLVYLAVVLDFQHYKEDIGLKILSIIIEAYLLFPLFIFNKATPNLILHIYFS